MATTSECIMFTVLTVMAAENYERAGFCKTTDAAVLIKRLKKAMWAF